MNQGHFHMGVPFPVPGMCHLSHIPGFLITEDKGEQHAECTDEPCGPYPL